MWRVTDYHENREEEKATGVEIDRLDQLLEIFIERLWMFTLYHYSLYCIIMILYNYENNVDIP